MTTKTYLVAEGNIADLTKRLDRIVRKAQKLGVAPVSYSLGGFQDLPYYQNNEGHLVRIMDLEKFKAEAVLVRGPAIIYRRFQEVEVIGSNPYLAGWTFVATLQHMADEQGQVINVLRTTPGFTGQLPTQFRTATPEHCDHCQKFIRSRKETFVLQHEDGAWKQVGRNCLADFLGGRNPQNVAAAFDLVLRLFDSVSDAADEGFDGGGAGLYRFGMESFLAATAMMVRTEGWTSRGKARASEGMLRASADMVMEYLSPPPKDPEAAAAHRAFVDSHPVTDEDREVAEKAMEYAREDLAAKGDARSDYEHNLYVATVQTSVDYRLAGIAASLVPYYLKEVERKVIREAELRRVADSKHLGQVGDKLMLPGVTVAKVITVGEFSQWGPSYLHELIDAEGNSLVWFSSNSDNNLKPGETYIIKATVKKHDTRDNVQQTVLTRLSVMTQEAYDREAAKAARKAAREAKKALTAVTQP